MWARNQTKEKIQRSFANAKVLMDDYPEYLFTLSQPELYRYLKEEAPEKYEELKQLVKDGRWEPEGSMWVEADCNLTCGESLVRQIMHGKKFFREEFQKETKALLLPDVFGYSAALPQILKKSGVDYFVTSKISWNDTNTIPYDNFYWEGIDGTEIFTTFITGRKADKNHEFECLTTYVGKIDAPFILGAWDRYQQKEYAKQALVTYGFGDGGGGPTREMLEKQRRLSKGIPGIPVSKMNFLIPYLEDVKKEFDEGCEKLRRTPKWVGELYLEFHRGTLTTMAKNKRNNRKSELALQKAEALSYTDLFFGGSYDAKGLFETWHTVLHNQFHDILPGTSVKEVYEGTDKDYAEVKEYLGNTVSNKIGSLAKQIKTDGGLLVYNSLGFERSGNVVVDGKTVELTDSIPAFGWAVVKGYNAENTVKVSGLVAENKYYKLTLNKFGQIVSIYDKEADREVIEAGKVANEFQLYEDRPYVYNAWEITDYYKTKPYVWDAEAEIEPITDGTRSGFNVTRKYMNSTVNQKIWLNSNNRRIDFDNDLDWHDNHHFVKIAFPFNIHTDKAAYEIQFGHLYRPTHENTDWERAKFEVCGQKWVDMSETGYGISMVNDCKYGFSAEGNTLKLTVLKCPVYPFPEADEGQHLFSYSLIPHTDSLYNAGIIKEAYSYNQPLEVAPISAQGGTLPESFSMVQCDAESVVVETVKKAETSDDMIVRMYESFGGQTKATVTVPEGFKTAHLCDLMENEIEKLDFDGRSVKLPIKNFEIVTLKFSK
jgi:alpha-mannosidase